MNCWVSQLCYIGKVAIELLSQIFMLAVHGTPSESLQNAMMLHVPALKVICNQTSGGLTPLTTMITRLGRSSVDIIIRAQQGPTSGTEEIIALQLLNTPRTEGSGALRLESIKLNRTNDYLSRLWLFCPSMMKMVGGTMFGALIGATSQDVSAQSTLSLPLPKLQNIALYGVHLNWTNFLPHTLGTIPNQLPPVSHSIQSLELSHLSGEVRPSSDEFSVILEACPGLQNLVLNISGPVARLSHQDDGKDDETNSLLKYCATHLLFPKLQELSLYNVDAPVNTFTLLMTTIPTLLHLLLYRTPNAVPALSPIQKSFAGASMPCPALQSIHIFPNLHKDSILLILKERSTSASIFAEWQCEEMSEGVIFTLENNRN
ncbi:hypothetical protein BD769DRAFT_1395861 [Suillus cothurnatus]|nr:hypothetical protein BD769DRAFT_1395861 [Suillus cothurnatus]